MKELKEYISKNKSALGKLFRAINEYSEELKAADIPMFIAEVNSVDFPDKSYDLWVEKNKSKIEHRLKAEQKFSIEAFALANLCGAVLQSASVTIKKFSSKQKVPNEFIGFMDKKGVPTVYCIGRKIRDVNIGMIIYAGRNQYNHIEDGKLRNPSLKVFELLMKEKASFSDGGGEHTIEYDDPAFDLSNPLLECYAHNILALMEWKSFDDYENDLINMLTVPNKEY